MSSAETPWPRWLPIIFGTIVVSLFIAGIWFFQAQKSVQRKALEAPLLSVAKLKVQEIHTWRGGQLADAAIMMGRQALVEDVQRYFRHPTEQAAADIRRRLQDMKRRYHYAAIWVVDPDRKIRLSLGPQPEVLGRAYEKAFTAALSTHEPAWTDFHTDQGQTALHLSVVAPLFAADSRRHPIGAIVLICAPARFLYPLIQAWPTPSRTAETLLVRRDGDEVLFLNELRHQSGTALKLRIPLGQSDLPAALAIRGQQGIVVGRDYRGKRVIAAILPVPDSPWFMVSKMDTAEAFAEWRFRSRMILVFGLVITVLAATVILFIRQRRLKAHYRMRYQTETALNEALTRHRITLQAIGDAVISTDTEGRVEFMNPVAESLTGWQQNSAAGKPLSDVFRIVNEETSTPLENPAARVLAEGRVVGLANHTLLIARDGQEIPISDSGSPIFDQNGRLIGVVLVFKDQTDERSYLNRIREREEKYRLLADNTLDVIWTMDADLVFTYVNPAIEQLTGHTPEEWLGTRLSDHCDETHFLEIARIIQAEIGKKGAHSGVVFETEMLRRDGSPIRVEIHGKVIFDYAANVSVLQGVTRDITQRRQTEHALRKSEALFERVFTFLPVGLWLADKEGRLIRGNSAGVEIWGAEPYVGPEDYGVFKAWRLPSREAVGPEEWALVHTVREGTVFTDELLEIEAFDGRRKFILNYTAPIIDDSGDVEAAVVVNLDVTERIAAEEALAESEARLRALVDAIPDLIWLKDPRGIYLSCNPAFERFFGAREADIFGKTDYDFVDKDLADFFREHDQKAMATGAPRMNEEYLIFADGSYEGDFETIKTPMRDSNGDIVGVLGIARDVSERKAVERALRENERRYKSTQQMGEVGNWEYDIPNETFWGSDEVRRMYGFDLLTDDFTVEEVESCIPERERVHQALVDLIEREKPYDIEFEIRPVDGSPMRIIRSIASLERDASGDPAKIMGVVQDITRQKEAEEEKFKLESQLHQAQKLESVGRLAGGVAHDFNNILSVIIGYAELAMDDLDQSEPLYGDLAEIVNAAKRSRNITRQLLAFARKETIAPEVLDLNDTVERLLKMLRRLIGEDIDLAWRPAPELWPIKMDPSQVDQILANLCVNARDAIKDVGKVTIETRNISIDAGNVDGHPWSQPGDFVLLTVSDDGCGMARETLDNIFEPFFTTKEVGRGTGLGMSTVYGITKQNNGFINVSSKPGQGTRFRIYLPRHGGGEAGIRRPSTKAVAPGNVETVLVVEDDPGILKLTARILEPLNYTLLTAGSPSEAIALAANHNGEIDLLITDVVMPDMNGRELSEALARTQPNLKTLFMSGYTADVIAHRGVLDSDAHFIHKPFSKKAFAVEVREALDEVRH